MSAAYTDSQKRSSHTQTLHNFNVIMEFKQQGPQVTRHNCLQLLLTLVAAFTRYIYWTLLLGHQEPVKSLLSLKDRTNKAMSISDAGNDGEIECQVEQILAI